METNVIKPLPPKKYRIKGNKYLYNNEINISNTLFDSNNEDELRFY